MPITTTMTGNVRVAHLEMPRGNALGFATIEALGAELDAAENAAALVVTGQGRTFSTGLDLVDAYDFDRPTMTRYVDAFENLFLRLFTFPRPVVAAINGHAFAGGCILAMATDYRVMTATDALIAINEVRLGIPFPSAAFEIARAALGPAALAPSFLAGRSWSPAEALAIGLVHRLATRDDVLHDAITEATAMANCPSSAAQQIKADLRAEAVRRIEQSRVVSRARFLDAWFSDAARKAIGEVRESLLRKKAKVSA